MIGGKNCMYKIQLGSLFQYTLTSITQFTIQLTLSLCITTILNPVQYPYFRSVQYLPLLSFLLLLLLWGVLPNLNAMGPLVVGDL